jgi:ketol-acid reductoisomerase
VLRRNGHSPSEAFNETVEELTESLVPLIGEKGMAWMFANTSVTAQRGALDWRHKFREASLPVFEQLYERVRTGEEARVVIAAGADPNYRARLGAELAEIESAEVWRAGDQVRSLRPKT